MAPSAAAYEAAIGALVAYYEKDVRQSAAEAAETALAGRNIFIAVCAAGVLLAFFFPG